MFCKSLFFSFPTINFAFGYRKNPSNKTDFNRRPLMIIVFNFYNHIGTWKTNLKPK